MPSGRGPFNGYWGIGKQGDRVLSLYNLDIKGVYLTGHSMSEGGTWMLWDLCSPEDTIQEVSERIALLPNNRGTEGVPVKWMT